MGKQNAQLISGKGGEGTIVIGKKPVAKVAHDLNTSTLTLQPLAEFISERARQQQNGFSKKALPSISSYFGDGEFQIRIPSGGMVFDVYSVTLDSQTRQNIGLCAQPPNYFSGPSI